MRPAANDFLDDLKYAWGLWTDVDLARRLGVKRGTLSSWRVRNSVPRKIVKEYAQLADLAAEVIHYHDAPLLPHNQVVDAIFILLFERYKDRIKFDDKKASALFWARIGSSVRAEITDLMGEFASDPDQERMLAAAINKIDTNQELTFDRIMEHAEPLKNTP